MTSGIGFLVSSFPNSDLGMQIFHNAVNGISTESPDARRQSRASRLYVFFHFVPRSKEAVLKVSDSVILNLFQNL